MKFSPCLILALTASLANNAFGGETESLRGSGNGKPETTYDCDLGCDLDEVGQGPPVCGKDGNSYFNECLAVCQEVEVDRPGVCAGDPPIRHNDDSYVRQGLVSKAEMDAFKAEKLKFSAKRKLDKSVAPSDEEPVDNGGPDSPGNSPDEVPARIKVKRVTRDGYEYAATIAFSDFPEGTVNEPTDGELGNPLDGDDRLLIVLGVDTRTETTAFSYPNWRLGELDYSNVGRCSGALIASNAVLTAAHCVYKYSTSQWMVPDRFAPGRHISGSSSWDPWGHWNVNYATIYTSYFNSGSGNYDVAVLNMGSSSAYGSTPIGNYMGTLGMKAQPCSYNENAMRITGYPGDKPDGSMWTTGVCDDWSYSCGSSKIYHKCDTAGGMSGSAIRDGGNYIVAVHTNGGTWNSGFAITSSTLGALRAWAGL